MMEFLRKTVIGLALVVGSLYTAHSIATEALKRLVPESATITVSRNSEQTGVAPTRDNVAANKPIIEPTRTQSGVVDSLNSEGRSEHLESTVPETAAVTALEPANLGAASSLESRTALAEIADQQHGSVLQALKHELVMELSNVFGNFLVQFVMAILGSCALGGATVYKLYPTLQRRQVARQRRAAIKRRQMRESDDLLLEGEEMANLVPPIPTRGDYS